MSRTIEQLQKDVEGYRNAWFAEADPDAAKEIDAELQVAERELEQAKAAEEGVRYYRPDFQVSGKVTPGQMGRLMEVILAACDLAGLDVGGGFTETDEDGVPLDTRADSALTEPNASGFFGDWSDTENDAWGDALDRDRDA